jgi:hypothetical protein
MVVSAPSHNLQIPSSFLLTPLFQALIPFHPTISWTAEYALSRATQSTFFACPEERMEAIIIN